MLEDTTLIRGESEGGVAQTTPAQSGGVAQTTPTQTSPDDKNKLTEYEEKIARYERDLREQKSSLQRREAQLTQEFRARERDYQSQLESIAKSSMDDEERKLYEEELRSKRLEELEEMNEQLSAAQRQSDETMKAYIWFTQNGIPPEKLVLDQGYDALYQSGMAALTEELQDYRTAKTTTQTVIPKELPTAPPVVTTTGSPAGTKPTWPELVQRYGSAETVYSLVEQGRLPKEIIP